MFTYTDKEIPVYDGATCSIFDHEDMRRCGRAAVARTERAASIDGVSYGAAAMNRCPKHKKEEQ